MDTEENKPTVSEPVNFTPDEELIEFANDFSKKYQTLSPGEYFSSQKHYHIRYLEKLALKNGLFSKTGIRVGNSSGIIEMDKSIIMSEEITPDFIYFIIFWCVIQKQRQDLVLSDKWAVKYYLSTGRSKNNLMMGYLAIFINTATELNLIRLNLIKHRLGK